MSDRGITLVDGLTAPQIQAAEEAHGFCFPPDLRSLLEYALPVGERFPDWRDPTSAFILDRLAWPADGICFDVEHNAFWMSAWGPRPNPLDTARAIAREAVRAAPCLIPVFAHRYLPAQPCDTGNPVFSVWQTDIICYGLDLPSYLFAEFGVPNAFPEPDVPRQIEFWSELAQ